jgi:predicted Zn-dependent protease
MTRVVAGGQILTETYYDGNEPVHSLGYTYQPWCIPYVTHLSSATSYINRYYTHDPNWSDHEVQQLAAHELGHAIGLYHIKDSFTDYAVMRGSIILGDSYWTPRPWDVTFVNCVYPNHRPC